MARKTFKENINNPAMSFISQESIDKEEREDLEIPEKIEKAPAGYHINPIYIENRSERLQLIVKPSLKAKLKGRAKREGTTLNNLVHEILEEAMRGE